MQKPGEGEMLMVTLEAMMTTSSSPDRAHPRGFYLHIIVMSEQFPSGFRRESSRTVSLFTLSRRLESFNIDADMARPRGEAPTPMPNIDDDLSMQKYISDRR